jgi:hypothetical protein
MPSACPGLISERAHLRLDHRVSDLPGLRRAQAEAAAGPLALVGTFVRRTRNLILLSLQDSVCQSAAADLTMKRSRLA